MQCSILNDYEIANIDAEYMGADGFEELRVYGRYLFGKVEQKCSFPKLWTSERGIKGNFEYEGRFMKLAYISESNQ